jgi:hypothetical protein
MGYGLDEPSSIPGIAEFFLLHSIQPESGAHLASSNGYRGRLPRRKTAGREADHPPASSVN